MPGNIDIRHYRLDNGDIRIEFGQQISFLQLNRASCLMLLDMLLRHLNGTIQRESPPAQVLRLVVTPENPDTPETPNKDPSQ